MKNTMLISSVLIFFASFIAVGQCRKIKKYFTKVPSNGKSIKGAMKKTPWIILAEGLSVLLSFN